MTATPERLIDALHMSGYTVDPIEIPAATITVQGGVIRIPAMLGSGLTWRREGAPLDSDSFYLTRLPVFSEAYRPVMLSQILDRFLTRRIGYNTAGEFGHAVRRWGNLHLGPGSTLNRMYVSAAVDMPLTTDDLSTEVERNETTSGTSSSEDSSTTNDSGTSTDTGTGSDKSRTATSDFPQGQLGDNTDYATDAADLSGVSNRSNENVRESETEQTGSTSGETSGSLDGTESRIVIGRSGRTVAEIVAEQRRLFVNADELLLDGFESLFLGVFDQPERERRPGPMPWPHGRW